MSRRRSPPRVAGTWAWPLALGTLTALGLVSALFSDGGWGDLLAGLCLAAPAAASLWFGWIRPAGVDMP